MFLARSVCFFVCIASLCSAQNISFSIAPGSPVPLSASMRGTLSRDINNDGIADILVTSANSNHVYVLIGAGNGQFTQAPGSPITIASGPIYIALADFNADGKLDMATANYYSGNVSIFTGNGNGSFNPIPGSPFATGSLPYCIDAADFNMDGKMDLVTCNAGSNNVMFFYGNGNGTFNLSTTTLTGNGMVYHVSAGHFNSDNFPDIAIASGSGNSTSVFLGTGTGAFNQAPGSPYPVGNQPRTISIGDLNSDGRQDLVVTNALSNNVHILLGSGSGAFSNAPGSPVTTGIYPYQSTLGDYNNDGKPDIAVVNCASNNITFLSTNSGGSIVQLGGSPFAAGNGPQPICSGDFDGDNKPDLALGEWTGNNLTILLSGSKVNCENATVMPSIATGSNLCTGLSVLFHHNSSNAGSSHWDFGVANLQTDTSSLGSPVYTFPSFGTYTITLTSGDEIMPACKKSVQKLITINPLLSPSLQPVYSSCYKNNQFALTVGGAVDPSATYQWTLSPTSLSSGTSGNPLKVSFSSPATQTLYSKVSQFGCHASLTTMVSFTNPVAAMDEDAVNCNEKNLVFINKSSDADSYYWDLDLTAPASYSSTQANPAFTYSAYGVYPIMLIATKGACKDTLKKDIRVFPKLALLNNPQQAPQCLKNNSFRFPANSIHTNSATFKWQLAGPNYDVLFSSEVLPEIHFPRAGTYTITLNIMENGCLRKRSETLNVYPQPGNSHTVSALTACQPAKIRFGHLSDDTQVLSYVWKIDSTLAYDKEVLYTFPDTGTFSYYLEVKNQFNCADSISKKDQIHIYPTPVAKDYTSSGYASMFDPKITFIDSTRQDHQTFYAFGDGALSSHSLNVHTYSAPGTYMYSLITVNSFNCSDTLAGTIVIDDIGKEFIPNIFTPNNDQVNDLFFISGDNITACSMHIFDRWNNLVFSSENVREGWNGTHAQTGMPASDGTYIYLIELILGEQRSYRFHGTVHLQR